MLVVGLTGGIGAGKTTVSALFAQFGVPIIDADIIAREVTEPNTPALGVIAAHFGQDYLLPDGSLNRSKLRDLIFSSASDRRWLEQLLHPLIRQVIRDKISLINAPYCIVVIPLLFDTAAYPFIQRVLVVDASESTQIRRVVARDKKNDQQVVAIIENQMQRAERLNMAHDVVHNDGSYADLSPQIEKLHQLYTKLGRSG